jgi:xylulokinase
MNPDGWILAIDLGNGGPKVGVVDRDDRLLAVGFRPSSVHIGLDGAATQDAVEWWNLLLDAAREAIDRSGVSGDDLHAVGITGQYASTVPVDAEGNPVGEVLLWADTRAAKYSRETIGGPINYEGYAPQRVIPWIRKTAGAPSPSGADPTGHSILLQREFPEIHDRAAHLLEPLDYLGMKITGRAAATPASMTASWLTDNRLGREPVYDDRLVRQAKRDPAKLPPLIPTGSVLGPVSQEAASALGVRPGVPVIAGLPDLHAAVLGSGAVEPYATHVVVSTTAWLSSRVPFKKTDILHSIASVPGLDNEYRLVINNIETGGAALRWLKEQVFPELSYDELTALAAQAPAGCEGVIFTPWLNGERSPIEDHHLRASFLNMSLRTDRSTMIRAVMEGVALNARWLFDYYVKFIGRTPPHVRIIGGGAQSDLWCQMHAYTLGVPVERPADPRDAQLKGAALWVRVSLGELTLEDAGHRVVITDTFRPDGPDARTYAALFDEYRRLYASLRKTQRRLSALPFARRPA